ncbi:hypothetical protein [Streptomyces sp. NPDC037389]|uniref:hypothetical protein n=1 Tax=Streptomyces sp. NPDC037389 TaxID=3155369 RepID=UPI0034023BF6
MTSNTDWLLTDAGLIVTESTIGSFDGDYNPHGKPEFVRSRVATQFADSIMDWTSRFAENNNAGYVNTWLLGGPSGRSDGEIAIACYELGSDPKLAHLEFKTDGYFAGCNVAQSQEIRLRECKDPMQHYDIRGNGARRITLDRLIKQEKVDLDRAKQIISDHTDVYTGDKDTGSSRSVCGHLDRDDGKYGNHGQPPFFPWGANDGKVHHAGADPMNLTFQGIWGNSCSQEFNPDAFCDQYPQYEEFRSRMNPRPPGATWETFPPGT